jgi:ferredoxin
MAYTITNQCISCGYCVSSCPVNAIKFDGEHYQIDPSQCNNCANYSVAQCWATCPTNSGCIPDSAQAFHFRQVKQDPKWEAWFDLYSHKLEAMLRSHPERVVHC